MECDAALPFDTAMFALFLSTHSCGVRQFCGCTGNRQEKISIHALLWSATALFTTSSCSCSISIHALLWSATAKDIAVNYDGDNFYPRTPVECDEWDEWDYTTETISIHALLWSATYVDDNLVHYYQISIHALLWSATVSTNQPHIFRVDFYPRTPVECDPSR